MLVIGILAIFVFIFMFMRDHICNDYKVILL